MIDSTTIILPIAFIAVCVLVAIMMPKEKFTRVVRYLLVPGSDTPLNQVLADQINQPPIEESQEKLSGQRILFYAALILAIIGIAVGLWAVFWN